jgi:5,5'-dehydrodivanillate O-demethylase
MGETRSDGSPPEFELPRKAFLERAEGEGLTGAKAERWPNNWFQNVENSLDAAHVSFVHQLGTVGAFGEAVTSAIPELSYVETDAGIEQTAVRGPGNVRKSDWAFPNNNHIVVPGVAKGDPWTDVVIWNVPNDDEHMTRFIVYATTAKGEAAERFRAYFENDGAYNPADEHDRLLYQGLFPPHPNLTSAQDYVATSGQGTIADRVNETLGRTDAGIVFLRNIFFRELDRLVKGEPTKQWKRLAHAVELPTQPGAKATA